MSRTTVGWALALVLAGVMGSGCGPGFRLYPASPLRSTYIADVSVMYAPALEADKRRMLDRLDVPGEMQRALRGSFPPGPGPRMVVVITQFRSSRWGPTRMHAVLQLFDPYGQVVAQFEADSTTTRGSNRAGLIRNVAQDCVNQLASRLQ